MLKRYSDFMTRTLLILILLTLVGCQKTRADYRNAIARDVCNTMSECGKVGPDGRFANLDDCETQMRDRYNGLWPAQKCTDRIDPEKFQQCRTRALTRACDGNLLDAVSFRLKCGANDVCTAEPPTP
jgi:hypothetical protein